MRYPLLLLTIILLFIGAHRLGAQDYSVVTYGARPDTSYNSTQAFQSAIDTCAARGGGRVLVPAGHYLIGSIFLRSNIELHLAPGAVVYGSQQLRDYRPVQPKFVSLRTQEKTIQLIYAEKAENLALTGTGKIDGQGSAFEKQDWNDEGIGRPHLIRFIECRNVRIENLSLRNSACWMQHYLACTDVMIRGLKIYNHSNYNNDGIDIDGCRNVTISDVIVDSDDDAIVLKSTSGRACENVVITNCIISSHCNALKLGTESNAGFRNIAVSNCVVRPSRVDSSNFFGLLRGISAISLEMVDGGELAGVSISNIRVEGTEVPLFIRLGARNRPFQKGQTITGKGRLHQVSIDNVTISGAGKTGCSITGMSDNPVSDIQLRNISIAFAGGGTREDAEKELPLADYHRAYPEATMFGTLPAHAFYIRHAEDITLAHIKISLGADEARPAFHLEKVDQLTLSDLQLEIKGPAPSAFRLNDVRQVRIQDGRLSGKVPHFVELKGDNNDAVQLINNDFTGCLREPVAGGKTSRKQVTEVGNIRR